MAEHARQQIKHHEPPRALLTVMQASGGEQDHSSHHPCADIDENRAPVLRLVDAPAGAEQKFEKLFHTALARRYTGGAGTRPFVAQKRKRVQRSSWVALDAESNGSYGRVSIVRLSLM